MVETNRSGDAKCIYITGGARGIGRATAELFHQQGWFVGAADLDEDGLASLNRELGSDRLMTQTLDVSDKPAFDRCMEEFGGATGGRLDLLFNNAGIGGGGWFGDVPYERAMRIVQVNFVGVVNGIYAALPLLERTPNSLVFNTSSSAAIFGLPKVAMYAATKFAVRGLTESLSVELGHYGVRCADVLPGVIDTPILDETPEYSGGERMGTSMRESAPSEGAGRLMQPEDVARLVLEAYGSDKLHWYIPEELGNVAMAKATGAEPLRDHFRKTVLDT